MSDADTRALERAAQNDPAARERLEQEWLRQGRGWHGEVLPEGPRGHVYAAPERGVYGYVVEGWSRFPERDIQLVYVPGGEVACRCSTERRRAGYFCPECLRDDRAALHRPVPGDVGRVPPIPHD